MKLKEVNIQTHQWIRRKPTTDRVKIHWIFFVRKPSKQILAARNRYVEGYKKELYMKKMKISSWRLLEPRNVKLEVQIRKGKWQTKKKGRSRSAGWQI